MKKEVGPDTFDEICDEVFDEIYDEELDEYQRSAGEWSDLMAEYAMGVSDNTEFMSNRDRWLRVAALAFSAIQANDDDELIETVEETELSDLLANVVASLNSIVDQLTELVEIVIGGDATDEDAEDETGEDDMDEDSDDEVDEEESSEDGLSSDDDNDDDNSSDDDDDFTEFCHVCPLYGNCDGTFCFFG